MQAVATATNSYTLLIRTKGAIVKYPNHCWAHTKESHKLSYTLVSTIIAFIALFVSMPSYSKDEQVHFAKPVHSVVGHSVNTKWLQVAERKARPGSGAYRRSAYTNGEEIKKTSEVSSITGTQLHLKKVKARPGSRARSRSKEVLGETLPNYDSQFSSKPIHKRSSARPGSRARKPRESIPSAYEKNARESLAQTPTQ